MSFTILFCSCSRVSQSENELRSILNTQLNIDQFDSVIHRDSKISFQLFRETYSYLSVVYLQEGCMPCYPKFVEWHQEMERIGNISDYSVLFIIQTEWPDVFFKKTSEISNKSDERFYIIIDPEHQFFIKNNQIPNWIMNSSMLIDKENKIKMVGAPWINEDMKNLFYKTVSSDQ
ncbi:hypothetical protein [Alkalitalea saponilacus]|nr:hypothetical protein [Alkalitalea saponilacus]ASB47939.1 hypothetical protein CDL62_01620 [Alkalitalea saponilacus]